MDGQSGGGCLELVYMKMKFEVPELEKPFNESKKKKSKKQFRASDAEPMSVAEAVAEESIDKEESAGAVETVKETPVTAEEMKAAVEALGMGENEKGEGYINAGATLKDLPEIMAQHQPAEEVPEPVVAEIKEPEVVVPRSAPVEKVPEAPKVVLEKKEKIPKKEQVNIHRPEKHLRQEQRAKFENKKKTYIQEAQDANKHEMRDIQTDDSSRREIDKWFKDLAKVENEKKVAEKRAEEIKQKIASQMKKPESINIQKGSEKLPSFWEKFTKFVSGLGTIKEDSKPKLDSKETENN